MVRMVTVVATLALLAACNNGDERIEELEDKIEQLESQNAGPAGDAAGPAANAAPTPGASASASRLVGPASSPAGAQSAGAADPDGNVCNDGRDRHLTLANRGEQSIMYFYASPPSAGDWEEDVLGDEVVSQGERFRINFNTDPRCTCTYDTRAVFADDSEVIRKVSVCEDHTQTYP